MVCLSKQYSFKFFKGCLPQILLDPLLNTLSQLSLGVKGKAFLRYNRFKLILSVITQVCLNISLRAWK